MLAHQMHLKTLYDVRRLKKPIIASPQAKMFKQVFHHNSAVADKEKCAFIFPLISFSHLRVISTKLPLEMFSILGIQTLHI